MTPARGHCCSDGKIDAYFAVAGVPLDFDRAISWRIMQARLVPIDGEGRDRLIAAVPQLVRHGDPRRHLSRRAVRRDRCHARLLWFTRDSEPDALIYGMTRALFNPANRGPAGRQPSRRAPDIGLDSAPLNPPAPLHPGAARFYREAGKLHECWPARSYRGSGRWPKPASTSFCAACAHSLHRGQRHHAVHIGAHGRGHLPRHRCQSATPPAHTCSRPPTNGRTGIRPSYAGKRAFSRHR